MRCPTTAPLPRKSTTYLRLARPLMPRHTCAHPSRRVWICLVYLRTALRHLVTLRATARQCITLRDTIPSSPRVVRTLVTVLRYRPSSITPLRTRRLLPLPCLLFPLRRTVPSPSRNSSSQAAATCSLPDSIRT